MPARLFLLNGRCAVDMWLQKVSKKLFSDVACRRPHNRFRLIHKKMLSFEIANSLLTCLACSGLLAELKE